MFNVPYVGNVTLRGNGIQCFNEIWIILKNKNLDFFKSWFIIELYHQLNSIQIYGHPFCVKLLIFIVIFISKYLYIFFFNKFIYYMQKTKFTSIVFMYINSEMYVQKMMQNSVRFQYMYLYIPYINCVACMIIHFE